MTEAEPVQKNEKLIKMTTEPIEKLVLSLAWPSVIIMMISALYNMADTYFVSILGTSQVAAVGIAFPLMAFIQAMGFFFGQGSGNYISRALGAQETGNASRMAATGFVSGFCFMTFIALLGLLFLEPLVKGLGATETILPFAKEYVFYILIASPVMVAATVVNQQLRFQGNAVIAMAGMLSGAILNIILDPIFIFAFRMGIKGAAIATLISQTVSLFILLFFSNKYKNNIPIKLKDFSLSFPRYIEMFRGGIPALLRQSLMSVTAIIINHFARSYGDAAIAAISISNRICMFANAMMLGFGQGFQPVCGFNFGAKLYNRVKKSFWFCVNFSCTGLFFIALFMAIFAPQIIALFRKDDLEVIAIGALSLRLNCISLPFMGGVIIVNMMTQTIGKALEASTVALFRHGIFLVPCLFIFSPLMGLLGVQIAVPVSELLSLIIVIPITVKVLKDLSPAIS